VDHLVVDRRRCSADGRFREGIFIGTLIFAIVIQGIYFSQIDRNWSNLIIGVTLLVAMAMNESFRQLALTYSPRKK
jgi:simple sugar transport system permease protein